MIAGESHHASILSGVEPIEIQDTDVSRQGGGLIPHTRPDNYTPNSQDPHHAVLIKPFSLIETDFAA